MTPAPFHPGADARREALLFSRDSMRAVDKACIEDYAIPGIVLMENAAAALADAALKLLENAPSSPLAMLCCGPGNNGGDGFALARRLHNEGVRCLIMCSRREAEYKGDAATNLAIAAAMNLDIRQLAEAPGDALDRAEADLGPPHLIVDAMFGTGLDRPVKAPLDQTIDWINARRDHAHILAVDVPTGLDADTGKPLSDRENAAVRAHATVTLGGMKTGLDRRDAKQYTGDISIGDIGAPIELLERLGTPRQG